MHELPVTRGILSVVLQAAEQANARRITAIDLVIGDFSSIVDDSVQFYFDILSRGTPAQGATLRFRRQAAVATCWDCSHQASVQAPLLSHCPACDSTRLQVSGGRAFYVHSMEVEDEDTGGQRDPQCQRSGGT